MNTIKKKLLSKIRTLLILIPGYILLCSQTTEYLGRYVNFDVSPAKFYDTDFNITFYIHSNVANNVVNMQGSSNTTGTGNNPTEAVNLAADTWNNVSGSFLNFTINSSTLPGTYPIIVDEATSSASQSLNVIGFDKFTNGELFQGFDIDDQKGDGSSMAIAYLHYTLEENKNCANWYAPRLFGADILFNPKVPWMLIGNSDCHTSNYANQADFQSVVLHELGHAAGLGHVSFGNSNKFDVMTEIIDEGECKRALSNSDIDAMVDLYGVLNHDHVSYIPCASFIMESRGDKLGKSGNCHCNCNNRTASQNMNISEIAFQNMVVFSENNLHFNINKLISLIADNQEEFLNLATSTSPKYKPLQTALDKCKNINAPLLNATFDSGVQNFDLTIKKENIDAFVDVLNLASAQASSVEFKKELAKLKTSICSMQGKTIKEAAIAYDRIGFE